MATSSADAQATEAAEIISQQLAAPTVPQLCTKMSQTHLVASHDIVLDLKPVANHKTKPSMKTSIKSQAFIVDSAGGMGRGYDVGLSAVPEPSTYLAGALLLLPFGFQGVRYLRRRQA